MSSAFPKAFRLLRSPEFRAVQRGRRTVTEHFIIYAVPAACPRIGLAVSRKVGNAFVRNGLKRRLRESYRGALDRFVGLELLVIAKPEARRLHAAHPNVVLQELERGVRRLAGRPA